MPELPEVETIARELHASVSGKILLHFSVFDVARIKKRKFPLPQKVVAVHRHGKFIVCRTDKGYFLLHLRMTGELLFEAAHRAPSTTNLTHERARFHFKDGSELHFIDVRRFGTVEWRERTKPLPILGTDPLSTAFTSKKLKDLLSASSRPVKSFLLDQLKISGIGNIYADEALWHARIHPARPVNRLKDPEITALHAAIRSVLREGIRKGGFTLRDYRRIDGSFGYYQKSRKVYGREGEGCLRCELSTPSKGRRNGSTIQRTKIGGRSSYFCPRCQV